MANPFYTPSPFVNFQYEPNRSEAQRVVDTMKEIKKERQEDEERELKLKTIQQNYEMGTMKMKQAQMEMEEVQRSVAADQAATQRFNSDVVAGIPKWQAIRNAVSERAKILGPKAIQEFEKEQVDMVTKYMSVADVDPAAAQEVADLINARVTKPEDRVTADQVTQAKARRDPVRIADGVLGVYNPSTNTYEQITTPYGEEKIRMEKEKQKATLENIAFDNRMKAQQEARLAAQHKAAMDERAEIRKERQDIKDAAEARAAEDKLVNSLDAKAEKEANVVRSVEKAVATGHTPEERAAALLAALGQETKTDGKEQDIKRRAVGALVSARARYMNALVELEARPSETAQVLSKIHRANIATLDGVIASFGGTPAPTNGKKPNKFESYNK